ncbi:hypothetical protein YC2023_098523 [Brassica napus]
MHIKDCQEHKEKETALSEAAVAYFTKFLQVEQQGHGLSQSDLENIISYRCSIPMAETLTSLVSAEDIHKIILSIPSGKTHGPDRYTKEFFVASWSVVGLDFVNAVQSFFQNGFMLAGVNGTVLTLIPKKTTLKR